MVSKLPAIVGRAALCVVLLCALMIRPYTDAYASVNADRAAIAKGYEIVLKAVRGDDAPLTTWNSMPPSQKNRIFGQNASFDQFADWSAYVMSGIPQNDAVDMVLDVSGVGDIWKDGSQLVKEMGSGKVLKARTFLKALKSLGKGALKDTLIGIPLNWIGGKAIDFLFDKIFPPNSTSEDIRQQYEDYLKIYKDPKHSPMWMDNAAPLDVSYDGGPTAHIRLADVPENLRSVIKGDTMTYVSVMEYHDESNGWPITAFSSSVRSVSFEPKDDYYYASVMPLYTAGQLTRNVDGDLWTILNASNIFPHMDYYDHNPYLSKPTDKNIYYVPLGNTITLDAPGIQPIHYDSNRDYWDNVPDKSKLIVNGHPLMLADTPPELQLLQKNLKYAETDAQRHDIMNKYVTNYVTNSDKYIVNPGNGSNNYNDYVVDKSKVTEDATDPDSATQQSPFPSSDGDGKPDGSVKPDVDPSVPGKDDDKDKDKDFSKLPWDQLFPFCLVRDIRLLIVQVSGHSDGLRYEMNLSFGEFSAPLVVDLSDWEAIQQPLHVAFDVALVSGLLWLSISLFLGARSND